MEKFKSIYPVLLKIIPLLFSFFYSSMLIAQISIGQNHPELKWKVIETSHFKIIYHEGIEFLAEEASRVAEHIYEPVTKDLGIEPNHKIPIIISDYDDESNGIATPLGHYIFIWAQSFHKYTTGSIKWLPEVITHEFVHLLNYWGIDGFPGFLREILALGFMPSWFIEGIAQYEAEQWDAHRDMLLRVATINDALLPTKKLTGYIGSDRIDARLVYEQGHSLVRYIAAYYGKDKIKTIIRKHRLFPFSFNIALKRSIGISEKDLYREWKQEIEKTYQLNWRKRHPIEQIGNSLPFNLQAVYGIRWSPDGTKIAVVGVKEFDEEIPRLYIYDMNGKQHQLLAEPYVSAFFSWSPDSRSIVYSKKRRGRNGSMINDLFVVDLSTHHERALTYSHRGTDPDWSPDGEKIVYCIHQGPLSNLAIFDLKTQTSSVLTSFENWTEIFTPCWSPDGSQIAFSLFDAKGKRDIAVINFDGSGFRKLTDDFIDDRYPSWSPNGKQIAFISYRNYNPNLFIKNLPTDSTMQISDVPGGVFNPTYHPSGDKIAVIAFENRSIIKAYSIDLANKNINKKENPFPSQGITWHNIKPDHYNDLYQPSRDSLQFLSRVNYQSFLNIRSRMTLPFFGYDDKGLQLGILNLLADPLGKHELLWSVTHRKRTHVSINYTNNQLFPTIQLSVNKTTLNSGDYIKMKDQDLHLWEKFWSTSLAIFVPFNFGKSLLSNHWLWTESYISKRQVIDNDKFAILKPHFRPFQGWINYIALGYQWTSFRPDVAYDIHPKSGTALYAYYRRSDKIIYSNIKFNELGIGFLWRWELPLKEHVIFTQLRSLFHQGEQPIQSRLTLGSSSIRGLDSSTEGDQMIVGNFEYRWSLLRDLGFKIWILYFERFCAALFYDTGKAWGTYFDTYYHGKKYNFKDTEWLNTTGVILRHRFYVFGKIPVVVHIGYGIILPYSKKGNLFFSLESQFF